MLTLTASAADAVRRLMSTARASAEPHAGVRISSDAPSAGGTALAVRLVNAPEATDKTIEEEGAMVFVEATAAEVFDGKVLDASVEAVGVRFTIREPRPSSPGPAEQPR